MHSRRFQHPLAAPVVRSLKWKPPSENSVDFKLQLRFPPDLDKDPSGRLPDLYAKPLFLLLIFKGSRGPEEYEFFDFMDVTDEEWEEWVSVYFTPYFSMWPSLLSTQVLNIYQLPLLLLLSHSLFYSRLKSSGQQLDDRIVEVAWWPGNEPDERNESQKIRGPHWHFLRIRDDKNDGNFDKVVHNILRSIKDGVEEEEVSWMEMAYFRMRDERRREGDGRFGFCLILALTLPLPLFIPLLSRIASPGDPARQLRLCDPRSLENSRKGKYTNRSTGA